MKLIIILLTTIITNACVGVKEASSNMKSSPPVAETNMQSSIISQDQEIVVEYSAITRGSFKQVKIGDGQISVQKSRTDNKETIDCKKEDWDKMMELLSDVHLENLSKLEAPSKAHEYDAALAASLTITKDGNHIKQQRSTMENLQRKLRL